MGQNVKNRVFCTQIPGITKGDLQEVPVKVLIFRCCETTLSELIEKTRKGNDLRSKKS